MQSLQGKINKLLTALRLHGRTLKVNTQQYYSEKRDKIVTKMILWETTPKEGETFYSKADLLMRLAEIWKEVQESDKEGEGPAGGAEGEDD
ncbi:MAG: hypothetical protein LUD50_04600 [Clostridia bacterium]|nr:hypothetical protein [Clostridia bacterium]